MAALTSTGREGRPSLRLLVAIVLLGALLRGWAVMQLPLDYDEPVYVDAAFDYAAALRAGDWSAVVDYPANREHPPLVKLLYAAGILALGQDPSWSAGLFVSRAISALFGVLAVLLLALVSPAAGGMLAVHTLVVKYTSQAYLEALPLFASLAAVLTLHRSTAARDRWFWLSALALGLTAASKYSYFPILFVILYLAIWQGKARNRAGRLPLGGNLLLYLAVAAAAFWLLDPALWRDPLARLADSLFFHARYSQSARVQLSGYPWLQPLYWISRSVAWNWHPNVFFYFGFDGIFFLLALGGLGLVWQGRRWVVVWLGVGLLFLLLWPTKWPQYTLILTPAICLAAGAAATLLYRRLREYEEYWAWLQEMIPTPPSSFWVVTGILVAALILGYIANTAQTIAGRLGWSQLTAQGAPLPSNAIYDIEAGPNGQMILGAENGAVIWSPPVAADLPDGWQVFTTENSALAHNSVRAVAWGQDGSIWFGAEAGLSRYDGAAWQTYRAGDMGLAGDLVLALAVGSDGRLWVGANAGSAAFDGQQWTPFTAATSGLPDDFVSSLAVTPAPQGDVVWFGTAGGVGRLDTATGQWRNITATGAGDWGDVTALTVDSAGRLWAGTTRGGLGLWDGERWTSYRVSNSDIPFNTVQAVFEAEPGVIWVGTAIPNAPGGVLATFDGQAWAAYTPRNSGFSGAEPLAMAKDGAGRLWIGTRSAGLSIFQPLR